MANRERMLLIGSLAAAGILLAGIIAPMATLAQQQAPSEFKFEYVKSGGIAGINERITFESLTSDSKTNVIKFFKGTSGAVEKQLSDASVQTIKQAIADAKFFELHDYPPKSTGAADYFSYSLTVTLDNQTHSVSWVDDFASSTPVPAGLGNIASKIEQAYTNASSADVPVDIGKRRITETVVQQSSSHNAEGHASHQAVYMVSAAKDYVYSGTVTFTSTKPVDILVYHDVTGFASEQLTGLTIHVVDNKSYAVTTLLKNVTSGTVNFAGAKLVAHTASSDPFTVVATIDVLRKSLTASPPAETKSFTVDAAGEKFVVHATDIQTIRQLVDNYNGGNGMHITGKLVQGDGGFNQPWSWHLEPASVRMADISIEVCDGKPSMVEGNLDYWLNTVGSYCPWSSKVVAIN